MRFAGWLDEVFPPDNRRSRWILLFSKCWTPFSSPCSLAGFAEAVHFFSGLVTQSKALQAFLLHRADRRRPASSTIPFGLEGRLRPQCSH